MLLELSIVMNKILKDHKGVDVDEKIIYLWICLSFIIPISKKEGIRKATLYQC